MAGVRAAVGRTVATAATCGQRADHCAAKMERNMLVVISFLLE